MFYWTYFHLRMCFKCFKILQISGKKITILNILSAFREVHTFFNIRMYTLRGGGVPLYLQDELNMCSQGGLNITELKWDLVYFTTDKSWNLRIATALSSRHNLVHVQRQTIICKYRNKWRERHRYTCFFPAPKLWLINPSIRPESEKGFKFCLQSRLWICANRLFGYHQSLVKGK